MKTTLRILPLMLGIMLFFTQCEKEAADMGKAIPETVNSDLKYDELTCNGEQELWAGAGQNILANGVLVGSVKWGIDGNTLYVKYVINDEDENWYLTETHLWVGDDIKKIPRNAAPGLFPYKNNHDADDFVREYEYTVDLTGFTSGKPLYLAAHGVVKNDEAGEPDYFSLNEMLPPTLSFIAVSGAPNSYLSLEVTNGGILNGQRDGWCLDPDIILFPNRLYDGVEVFSSYNVPEEHPLKDELDNFGNLELVNWIINFITVGDDYTYTEVQQAIWELLFDEVNVAGFALNPAPRTEKVIEIKNLAQLVGNGPGFVPDCGHKVAIVLYKSGTQPVIIEYPVPCSGVSETAWAFGDYAFNKQKPRIAQKWGWVFKIDCY